VRKAACKYTNKQLLGAVPFGRSYHFLS